MPKLFDEAFQVILCTGSKYNASPNYHHLVVFELWNGNRVLKVENLWPPEGVHPYGSHGGLLRHCGCAIRVQWVLVGWLQKVGSCKLKNNEVWLV